ncbi:Top3a [Symbiodinium sp. CCMP2592]|nr:Top3a [Symbiodinium sp. CCMP2592]
MCRFAATNGPLSVVAICGSQSTLLSFDVDETAGHLLDGLAGFAVCRTVEKQEEGLAGGEAETVWFGDPRRGKWSEDAELGPAEAVDEVEVLEETRALGGGWRRALRCAIQEFKWGDYTTKPNTRYRYTLCAIHGDPQIGIDSSPSGGPAKRGPGLHVAAQVELEVVIPAADGDHQVFFNRGVAGSQRFARLSTGTRESGPRSWEQWQWLSNGLEEALLSFIGRAHKGFELRCAFYEAHYPPVMRALAAAERRGASVQIVMDWKIASWSDDKKVWSQRGPQHLNYWALAESGLLNSGRVFHRTRPLAAISHNKFIILTAPDGALSVWTGSTNITAGAIFGHSNVGHIVARPALCKKYMAYWERLTRDPEKKDLAQFNEQLSPLPEEESKWTELVLFSPRLRWADALSFMAQLILKARHSVAFTAAFGISREISPALLAAGSEGAGMPVPTYLLLESQGNWQASRDAVQALQRKSNVRVAFGMHMEVPPGKPQPQGGAWIPETLTGLNEHVRYVHTKILLIDMFSDEPIVVSGSGNFSRASMESNDENVVVVRGNTNLSDAYSVEFFRIFEHMRFRNHVQGIDKRVEVEPPGPQAEALDEVMCRCGQAVAERTVKKAGPNVGRRFRCCANPQRLSCGFFAWTEDAQAAPKEEAQEPWPRCCYSSPSFPSLERQLFKDLRNGATSTVPFSLDSHLKCEKMSAVPTQEEEQEGSSGDSFASADDGLLRPEIPRFPPLSGIAPWQQCRKTQKYSIRNRGCGVLSRKQCPRSALRLCHLRLELWDLCGVSEDPAVSAAQRLSMPRDVGCQIWYW